MLDDKIALVKQDVAAMVEELEHTKEELRTEKTKNAKLCREVFDLNADIAGLMEEAESDAQLADLEEANEILADEIAGLAKEKDALADKIELLESELYKWKSRARANKMAKKELGKIQRQWKYILSTLGDDVKEWESETDSDLDSD
jgi:chromosome segregation ATPase